MHIKSIVAGAAIALAATVGSAYAADQFATVEGIAAESMNTAELDRVRGTAITLNVPGVDSAVITAVEDIVGGVTLFAPSRNVPAAP